MEFTMNEHSFSTKLPFGELEVSGNEEYGFRPYQLLVSAVTVCSGGVLRKILNKQRLIFEMGVDGLFFDTDFISNL